MSLYHPPYYIITPMPPLPPRHPSSSMITPDTSSLPIPLSQPAPPTRTMATRSMHGIYKPKKLFNLSVTIDDPIISPLPKTPKVALFDPNWKSAMQSEFNSLIRNNTRDLIPRPCDVNIIHCMWIFRHKNKSNGCSECYQGRLVGDGMSQIAGVNYDETFSHMVKPVTIYTILTIALSKS